LGGDLIAAETFDLALHQLRIQRMVGVDLVDGVVLEEVVELKVRADHKLIRIERQRGDLGDDRNVHCLLRGGRRLLQPYRRRTPAYVLSGRLQGCRLPADYAS